MAAVSMATPAARSPSAKCDISLNSADVAGGGLSTAGLLKVLDCNIHDNSAFLLGGGVHGNRCIGVVITSSTVNENTTSGNGGGISIDGTGNSQPTCSIHNSVIALNEAGSNGGGFHGSESTTVIVNCTIAGNDGGATGGGILLESMIATTVTNSILWDNMATTSGPEISYAGTAPVVTYSDVEGGFTGTGNINSNPNFDGNYRLQCLSPCMNVGLDGAAISDGDDVDEDNNFSEKIDRDLSQRIVNTVDMGAFEKNNFCDADLTGPTAGVPDGIVNVQDLLFVIGAWGPCPGSPTPCPADIAPGPCSQDGTVNVQDLLAVIAAWGYNCPLGRFDDLGYTVQDAYDCMDAASLVYTPYSEDWYVLVNGCLDKLAD